MWAETRHQFESSIWAIVRGVEICRPALDLAMHTFSFTTFKSSVVQCHAPSHAMVWLVNLGMWSSLWLGWLGSSSFPAACRGPPWSWSALYCFHHFLCWGGIALPYYLDFWLAAPLCFSTGNQTFQLSAISETQMNMSSNSHTAKDTKACHLQKLPLQKSKKENVGVPDTLIDLWDASSKTAVMSA